MWRFLIGGALMSMAFGLVLAWAGFVVAGVWEGALAAGLLGVLIGLFIVVDVGEVWAWWPNQDKEWVTAGVLVSLVSGAVIGVALALAVHSSLVGWVSGTCAVIYTSYIYFTGPR